MGQGAAPAGVLDLRTARTRAAPGLRPAATTGCLPGAWLTDGPRVARSTKSAAGAGRKTLRWRAERRPCSREGVRYLKNNGCATWRAIPLNWRGRRRRDYGVPGAAKNTGAGARLHHNPGLFDN